MVLVVVYVYKGLVHLSYQANGQKESAPLFILSRSPRQKNSGRNNEVSEAGISIRLIASGLALKSITFICRRRGCNDVRVVGGVASE